MTEPSCKYCNKPFLGGNRSDRMWCNPLCSKRYARHGLPKESADILISHFKTVREEETLKRRKENMISSEAIKHNIDIAGIDYFLVNHEWHMESMEVIPREFRYGYMCWNSSNTAAREIAGLPDRTGTVEPEFFDRPEYQRINIDLSYNDLSVEERVLHDAL